MKKFWKNITLESTDNAHAIRLDGRAVKTPMKSELILPNTKMADAVRAEWEAVDEEIIPANMPITGFANAAIDRISADRNGFIDSIAAYGESDLFCYRAESPDALVERQSQIWDKWLRWAQARYVINFTVISGIMHQPQPEVTLTKLKEAVAGLNDFQLSAASRLVAISGSLIALLALTEGEADADAIWPDLILDELWQEEQWGADEYAIKNRTDREADFMDAANFLKLAA